MIERFILQLKKEFPSIPVYRMDERFTSKMASQGTVDERFKEKSQKGQSID